MSLAGIEPGRGENTPQHKPLGLNLINIIIGSLNKATNLLIKEKGKKNRNY